MSAPILLSLIDSEKTSGLVTQETKTNVIKKKKIPLSILRNFQETHLKLGAILTTRFNAKTWTENQGFLEKCREKMGIQCVYCAPSIISDKIVPKSRCAVLEMDNDKNQIMGIGLIENMAYKKKLSVYEWGYYNHVNYVGYFRIDRMDMTLEELKTMDILDMKCFKGCGHLKRGKGLTSFPMSYLFDLFEKGIEIDTFIREMFNRRFLVSTSVSN